MGCGLGLGLFLAGVMLLVFPGREPSREEIISKARSYGMVFREEVLTFRPGNDDLTPREKAKEEAPVKSVPQAEVLVTIPSGAGLEEIAALLEENRVVKREEFEAAARRAGLDLKLKAGSYYLPRGNVEEVLRRLTE